MKKWLKDWKGTNVEINELAGYYLDKIEEEFSVDRKTAKNIFAKHFREI